MRAYQITGTEGFDSLTSVELPPPPAPGPQEVLIGVQAVSLNYRDYMNVCGLKGVTGPIPRIPCSDGAGEVLRVGSEVSDWKAGDRVVVPFMPTWLDGGFSQFHASQALGGAVDGLLVEQALLPASSLVSLPDSISFERAATLPCAATTAWNALIARGQVRPGETVLILGSGGVSVFALQMAVAAGARVLAISSQQDKCERLTTLGADATLNYREHPEWDAWALEQTDGLGVDHVVEIGGPETLARSISATRFGGHVALIGVLTGVSGEVPTVQILRKGLRLNGIYVGSRTLLREVVRAVDTGRFAPVIDQCFPFEAVHDAFRHLESGNHFGKIVVTL